MTDWSAVLEEDLRWREAELASLKRIAITNSDNEIVLRATLRASWAMLYAHFEGFTKFCWELLLDQVQSRGISTEDLAEDFLLLALESHFRLLRSNLSSASLWKFFRAELPGALQMKAAFKDDCRLETESNLWPSVYERECARVGISSSLMRSYSSRMRALVSRRNDIAHGKSMTVRSVSEFAEYENCTLLVLHDLALQVLEILEKEAYRSK